MALKNFLHSIPHKFNAKQEELLRKAFAYAEKKHAGQKRKSGEDYFIHPVGAAIILGQVFPDASTIAATFLHDIPEDTKTPLEEIKKEFGAEIAALVDGVTKLGHVR